MQNIARPTLVLIDLQKGFEEIEYWGTEISNTEVEQRASELLLIWRIRNWPVYHIKHNSTNEESPLHIDNEGNDFLSRTKPLPHETVIEKTTNNAFIDTELEDLLLKRETEELVICGLTTDHCVSTSVRMASNLGFKVTLVEDACATFDRIYSEEVQYSATLMHAVNIASLKNEFAEITTTEELKASLNTFSF